MNKIDAFLNKFVSDLDLNPDDIKEMKEEMRSHLLDYVKEAQLRGLTEQEAITEALEHFGDEKQIRNDFISTFPKKTKKLLLFISLLFLISAFLLPVGHYTFFKYHEIQREGFLRGIGNNLIYQDYDPQKLEEEVEVAVQTQVLKDILIRDHPSQNIVYRTIDNEGFGQDDSFWIKTVVERHTIGSGDKVYYLTYSYNMFIKSWLISIVLLFCYWFLFPLWFFKNHRDTKWSAIILVTNFIGYWAFKRVSLKNSNS